MASEKATQRLYAFGMFLAVSVLAGLLTAGLAFPFASMAGTVAKVASDSMDELPAELDLPPRSERSRVLMADGRVLATFYNENRVNVPLSKISKNMQNAQIAIEDQDFYKHGAINLEGIIRQLVRNTSSGEVTGGGSTLTQQYVKMVLIEKALQDGDEEGIQRAQEQTMERKIREMRYAIALEKKLTKDQILEGYLNIAYYGAGAYGVEAAAFRYFGTTAEKLTIAQSAMLAGLVKNPSAVNPIDNLPAAMNRRSFVIGQMLREGYISKEEAAAADAEPFDPAKVKSIPSGCIDSPYPQLCDYVKRVLISDAMPGLGATPADRENTLNRGGLTIKTLIDPKTQDAAQAAIYKLVKPSDPAIATSVMLQPSTGLIVAMAQSRPRIGTGPGETYFNYSVSMDMGGAEGYPGGSTFKMFTLAAALEMGYPVSREYDSPRTLTIKRGEPFATCDGTYRVTSDWKVINAGSGYSKIDLRRATASSVNTYYAQLIQDVGICASIKMADRLGLQRSDKTTLYDHQFPTFVLGNQEVTPLSLTVAYSTLANRGVRCEPRILESIQNREGKPVAVPPQKCEKVLEPEIADGVTDLLKGVLRGGTGSSVALPYRYDQAGKTGTSNDNEAIWLAGYTPELAGTAMIAVDKKSDFWKGRKRTLNNLRLPSGTWITGFGGTDAGKIWRASMLAGLEGRPATKFKAPPSKVLTGVKVAVPSVAGMSLEQAKATLREAGFSTTIFQVYSDRPAGTFLGISPTGQAVKFSTIALRVSRGPEPKPDPVEGATPPSATPPPGGRPTEKPR